MTTEKANVSGKLGLRPKSYVVQVTYKSTWPSKVTFQYHYHSIEEATAHLDWVADQVRGQNGKDAKCKNVVTGYSMEERLRSKKLDKRLTPVARFIPPEDRHRPEGGVQVLPKFEESGKEAPQTGAVAKLVRVK